MNDIYQNKSIACYRRKYQISVKKLTKNMLFHFNTPHNIKKKKKKAAAVKWYATITVQFQSSSITSLKFPPLCKSNNTQEVEEIKGMEPTY